MIFKYITKTYLSNYKINYFFTIFYIVNCKVEQNTINKCNPRFFWAFNSFEYWVICHDFILPIWNSVCTSVCNDQQFGLCSIKTEYVIISPFLYAIQVIINISYARLYVFGLDTSFACICILHLIIASGRSFIYRENKSGPEIDPWGTLFLNF